MTVGPGWNSSLTFSRTNLKNSVSVSPPNSYWYKQHSLPLEEEKPQIQPDVSTKMSFHLLPYDLLLNVASYLDVHCLQLVNISQQLCPLPLKGFQHLRDLSTTRHILPITHEEMHNNYLDLKVSKGSAASSTMVPKKWFKVIHTPPGKEVDWLSPITSSYTLCATKSGKVVCWDVQTNNCLAERNPRERWELWKCQVEFEDKMVYFIIAKILHGLSVLVL
ncbi:hypothetical protein BT96DRAFT_1074965 [Gymnopus androsaceus JB14]|uniref:F-box domain-containing protein n=1 Tax=Gymnopus androsaceus JB14 TaxID=1447944 RepID=A0A6A4GQV2_9AGAR|nr:hypothetical protein BT96DRAFT_1074965 [Gymnopus androsaceus JB14]